MRVRTSKELNLIKIHFSMQEVNGLNVTQEEATEKVQEANGCEGGVCSLNWSPVRPSKKEEAA
ncbi:MAG: hypothetical protein SGJ27_10865 [Candidatus Melainabacteria bacterium]|nr:hypothetical protein [Candidatus Melainabacteria bacterium]